MKKTILRAFLGAFAVSALTVCICTGAKAKTATEYPTTFEVYAIDEAHDLLILQDFSGNVYAWEGAEDWMVGDVAAAIMDDNGTENIKDDVILDLRYTGYLDANVRIIPEVTFN